MSHEQAACLSEDKGTHQVCEKANYSVMIGSWVMELWSSIELLLFTWMLLFSHFPLFFMHNFLE